MSGPRRIPRWGWLSLLALATVLLLMLLPGAPLHAVVPWLRTMTTSEAPTAATRASRAAASRETSGDALTARAATATATAGIGPARGVTSGAPRVLPFERRFIRDGGLNVDQLRAAFGDRHFDDMIRTLQDESSRDADASDQSRAYRDGLARLAQQQGDVGVAQFACGLSLCLGTARGASAQALATWSQAALAAGKSLPMYSFVAYPQTLDDGQSALRFAFSLDPTVAAMTGRMVPVPLGPSPPGP